MNEQAKNIRIIIDASYIRGMSRDGAPLRTMREQGGRIVLIDTLTYELFSSTDDSRKWSESKVKLAEHRDYIEVWKHVSEMWIFELTKKCPCGDPLDNRTTECLKKMLANDPQWKPSDSKKIIDQAKRNREDSSIIEMLKALKDIELFTREEKVKIRGKQTCDKEVAQFFYDFVNNPANIRLMINIILQKSGLDPKGLDPNDVDETWAIWHFGKSLLVMYCYSQYQDRNIHSIPRESLMNTKHDLDYLMSLAFADAIASKDKKEMSYFRQWMFGDTKPLIDSYCPEKIARVMDSLKGDSSDRPSQSLGDKDQEPLSQVDFMQLSLEERRQILAQQADQLKTYYERTRDERTKWQTGDFIDVY